MKTRGRILPPASTFMYSCSLADVSWGHSFHHLSAARLILFRVVGIWNKSQNALGREPDRHTHTLSDSLPAHRVSLESHDDKIIKDKDQNFWLLELVTHTFTPRYKFSTHNTFMTWWVLFVVDTFRPGFEFTTVVLHWETGRSPNRTKGCTWGKYSMQYIVKMSAKKFLNMYQCYLDSRGTKTKETSLNVENIWWFCFKII